MNTWSVAQGVDATFQVTICDDLGNPITTYVGTEPLTGVVWPGDDLGSTFMLTVTWVSAAAGTINVAIAASSTQALGVGKYRVQITLVDSGTKDRDVYEGELEIFASPLAVATSQSGVLLFNTYAVVGLSTTTGLQAGWLVTGAGIPAGARIDQVTSSTTLNLTLPASTSGGTTLTITPAEAPVYCQYTDMQILASWIGDLQSSLHDETGFALQRANARKKTDSIILHNYRGHTVGQFGEHSTLAFNWAYGGGKRRSILTSPIVRQWLASNCLLVRDEIIRINAHWAIADVCLSQMGRGGHFPSYGGWHRREGDKLCAGTTAELDLLPQDGFAEIGVPLGSTNTLFT